METEQFYVTLPSNTDKENVAANFRVKLPRKILLQSDNWVVGLAEIIYPFTWHNIVEGDNRFYIDVEIAPGETQIHKIKIIPSFYESIEEILLAIESALQPLRTVYQLTKGHFNITYVARSEQVIIHIDPKVVKGVTFTEKSAHILGFDNDIIYKYKKGDYKSFEVYAHKIPDIRNNLQTMFVYCDIVSQQIVRDILAPLLRIIDVQGRYKDNVNRTYDVPHYVPVLTKDIDAIEIAIKDGYNDLVKFTSGSVIVKLHFKQRSVYAN